MPAPPTVEPDASPTTCIEINEEWASWLQGRVWNMEFEEWSDPWGDAAIDKASRLADLFAGNCSSGGGVLENVRKAIVPIANVTLNSATRVPISPLHQLNINPTANAKYRVSWTGYIRNNSATVFRGEIYMVAGGIVHYVGAPLAGIVLGIARYWYHFETITDALPAGPTIVDWHYLDTSGSAFLEWSVSGRQMVYTLTAIQVE